jgi:enterochelin esterase family protein
VESVTDVSIEEKLKATLMERAEHEGTPLIDGETVTFVWRGEQAPQLIGDFNNWGWGPGKPLDLIQVAPGVWAQTVTLPLDAYVEYTFVQGSERVRDPLNPQTISNGVGALNQFFRMPDSVATPLVRQRRGIPQGTVSQHVVDGNFLIVGGKRTVYLYQPPTTEPVPLLVVFDGQDYYKRARLPQIVENLLAEGSIRPLALAMVEHGRQARIVEYMCSDSTVAFLLRHVLPLARQQLNLLDINDHPGAYGVLGASMGGLISLYTAMRVPEVFGRVLSQSGTFGFTDLEHDAVIFDLINNSPTKPVKIWMDVGQFEWLLTANRRMHEALQEHGYAITYREYPGEHNYTSWRDDLAYGLEALFAPEPAHLEHG